MTSCGDCAAENDDTRVFCMNCGVRLPESNRSSPASRRASAVGAAAPPLPTKKKNEGRPRPRDKRPLAGVLRFSIRMLPLGILAVFALAGYLALQGNPASVAPSRSGTSGSGQEIAIPEPDAQGIQRSIAALQAAARSPNGVWSADQSALTSILSHYFNGSTVTGPGGAHVHINAASITLEEGRASLHLETRLESVPLLCVFVLAPEIRSGKLGVKVVDGRIGRLPLPGPMASILASIFQPLLAKMEPVLSITESAGQASISSKKLVIRWGAAGRS